MDTFMKQDFTFRIVVLAFLISMQSPAAAQENEADAKRGIETATELYNAGQWTSARAAFERTARAADAGLEARQAEIHSYIALCAINENSPDADGIVAELEKDYPFSPMLAHVKFALSSAYFSKNEYDAALELANSVEGRSLYKDERDRYAFERAYSNMMLRRPDEAEDGYRAVIAMPYGKYSAPSRYYLGYLLYGDGRFREAAEHLEKSEGDSRFALYSKYFLLECHLMMKDYGYVVKYGPAIYSDVPDSYKAGLSRMISNAFYETGDIGKAKEYMDDYRNTGAGFSRKDSYYDGMISFSMGQYSAAVEAFARACGNDSLGQNAYYHLAKSYLKVRNKHAALNAFKSASQLGYDPVMTEDAFYNYAKLSFDVNSDV